MLEKIEKKRILYVEGSRAGTVGGSHKSLYNLLKHLNSQQYDKILLSYEDSFFLDSLRKIGVDVVLYKDLKCESWNILVLFLLSFIAKILSIWNSRFIDDITTLSDSVLIASLIKSRKIDILHANNAIPINKSVVLAGLLTKRCIVVHERGYVTYGYFDKLMAEYVDCVIFISKAVRNNVLDQGVIIKNDKIVYDCIDQSEFKVSSVHSDIRKEYGIDSNSPLVALVSNFVYWKGHLVVVSAMAVLRKKYPDLRCLFVGGKTHDKQDFAYYNNIQCKIKENSLERTIFQTGYRDDVPDILSKIDILISSSTTPEPFGLTVPEAALLDIAVVASDTGGPAEIIKHEKTGLLFKTGDHNDLARNISRLLDNREFSSELVKNARKEIESKFRLQTHVELIDNIYTNYCGSQK